MSSIRLYGTTDTTEEESCWWELICVKIIFWSLMSPVLCTSLSSLLSEEPSTGRSYNPTLWCAKFNNGKGATSCSSGSNVTLMLSWRILWETITLLKMVTLLLCPDSNHFTVNMLSQPMSIISEMPMKALNMFSISQFYIGGERRSKHTNTINLNVS